jgi:hypothetical protein
MARQSHYRRHKQYKRTCPVDGQVFTCTRSDARYCSPACRQQISRAVRLVANVAKHIGAVSCIRKRTPAKGALKK